MKKQTNPTNIPTVTKTYTRLSDENLTGELDRYVDGLMNNTYFPQLKPQIDDYIAVVTNYRELQAKASASRDKNAGLERDNARTNVILATISISNAVAEAADGDLVALASTNLPLRKPKTPIVPEGPGSFKLTASTVAGRLDVTMKKTKGIYLVVARYALAPLSEKTEWITINSTTAKFSIEGLTPGAKYYVQLGVIVKGTVTMWGDTLLSPFINGEL